MHELKRRMLYVLGVMATIASVCIGAFVLLGGLFILGTDGIGGATKQYQDGAASSEFILNAAPFVVVGIILFFLGAYLRENNRERE